MQSGAMPKQEGSFIYEPWPSNHLNKIANKLEIKIYAYSSQITRFDTSLYRPCCKDIFFQYGIFMIICWQVKKKRISTLFFAIWNVRKIKYFQVAILTFKGDTLILEGITNYKSAN